MLSEEDKLLYCCYTLLFSYILCIELKVQHKINSVSQTVADLTLAEFKIKL